MSWFNDKELSLRVDVIVWNSLKRKIIILKKKKKKTIQWSIFSYIKLQCYFIYYIKKLIILIEHKLSSVSKSII